MTNATSHSQRKHGKYSPSQAERFLVCSGSVKLIEQAMARQRTVDAEGGDIAHEVLEAGLLTEAPNATTAILNSVHAASANDVNMFSNEFKAAINDAMDFIFKLKDDLEEQYGDVVMFVERFVDTPSEIAPGETGGMCDVALYSKKARRLWVMDYKHGVGVAKDVVGNVQVKQYGAGFLYEQNAIINPDDIDAVTLVIIQPRAFHAHGSIREYTLTPAEIYDYLFELDAGIERCEQPGAPLVPGEEQCRFCPAKTICPAYELSGMAALHHDFKEIADFDQRKLTSPKTIDADRIARIVAAAPMIRAWLKSVEDHAEELARSGMAIPGQKLVEAKPKREYYRDAGPNYRTDEMIAKEMANMLNVPISEVYKPKLISITDAEKLYVDTYKARVGRGKRKHAAEDAKKSFAYLTDRKSSGNLTLVPADDPRPAVNKAMQSFGGISGLIPPPPERN